MMIMTSKTFIFICKIQNNRNLKTYFWFILLKFNLENVYVHNSFHRLYKRICRAELPDRHVNIWQLFSSTALIQLIYSNYRIFGPITCPHYLKFLMTWLPCIFFLTGSASVHHNAFHWQSALVNALVVIKLWKEAFYSRTYHRKFYLI